METVYDAVPVESLVEHTCKLVETNCPKQVRLRQELELHGEKRAGQQHPAAAGAAEYLHQRHPRHRRGGGQPDPCGQKLSAREELAARSPEEKSRTTGRAMFASVSRTPAAAWIKTRWSTSLSRSLPPKSRARAPAWGWHWRSRLSAPTGATSWPRAPLARGQRSISTCPCWSSSAPGNRYSGAWTTSCASWRPTTTRKCSICWRKISTVLA